MEKRAFDRHYIDDMQSDKRRIEDSSEVEGVGLRVAGMFGGVDADKNFLDQADALRVDYRDNTARGEASRADGMLVR